MAASSVATAMEDGPVPYRNAGRRTSSAPRAGALDVGRKDLKAVSFIILVAVLAALSGAA